MSRHQADKLPPRSIVVFIVVCFVAIVLAGFIGLVRAVSGM